jgi:hypothetical protein
MNTTTIVTKAVRIAASISIVGLMLTQCLTGAGPAHAATPQTRYAAPHGVDGSTCAHAHPCTITGALAIAETGDTVILGSGTYGSAAAPLQTSLEDNDLNLTIRGETAKPSVRIFSAAPNDGVDLEGASSLSGVALTYSGGETALSMGTRATGDHIVVAAGQSAPTACSVLGTLTNAVCWAQGTDSNAVLVGSIGGSASAPISLRDVDAIASGASGIGIKLEAYESQPTLNVTNTIAMGGEADIYNSADDSSSTSVINIDHSAFATQEFGDFPFPGTQTINRDPSDVKQRATFIKAVSGNFHEKAGSKTIDHGVRSAVDGAMDVAGQQRYAGAATDIGAYEFQPRPQLGRLKITKRTKTAIVVTVTVHSGRLAARVQLLGYRAHHHAVHGVARVVTTGPKGTPVRLALGKLRRRTTYRLSATIRSAGGKATTVRLKATTR